jgi:hypothetical protein
MSVYRSVRAAGVDLCERGGYDVETTERADQPAAVATPTDDAVGLVDEPRPIAVEALDESTVEPGSVLPRLSNALDDGRDCLFVVPDPEDGDTVAQVVASVLSAPTGVAEDAPEGRQFYSGVDRIPLSDGTYACARAPADRLRWREVEAGADRPRLELSAGSEIFAVLEHVDALATPERHAFQHAYRRGAEGRFEVTEREEIIDTFGGVSAMRRGGYTPVAMPLVPEHLFPPESSPERAWSVCTAREDPTVYGPDGADVWP